MNTIVERFGGGPITLSAFAESHGLSLRLYERSRVGGAARWMADFKNVEIKWDGILSSAMGNGNTPEEAVEDFKRRICGVRLVENAMKDDRREWDVPNEFLPETTA